MSCQTLNSSVANMDDSAVVHQDHTNIRRGDECFWEQGRRFLALKGQTNNRWSMLGDPPHRALTESAGAIVKESRRIGIPPHV